MTGDRQGHPKRHLSNQVTVHESVIRVDEQGNRPCSTVDSETTGLPHSAVAGVETPSTLLLLRNGNGKQQGLAVTARVDDAYRLKNAVDRVDFRVYEHRC